MKLYTLIIAFVSLALGLQAGEGNKINFTEATLDNGLKVILHQDNSTPIVVVSVMYHVGSKNENPNRTGFAHFFEHLLFEGSENIARGQFDDLITNAGGVNNAYTSQDETYYYEVLPSNQLELGLYLESERLMHAKILDIGVETQREVVKEEKRQRYDNQPYGTLGLEIFSNSFKEHPYKWSPIGSMEHLNQASLQEFMNFYNKFYIPENATLVLAGDFETKEAMALVHKYFDEIRGGNPPVPRPTIVEPKQTEERRKVIYDEVQLPAVVECYHIPEIGTEDYYALEMLSTLLSGGESSRLNKSLVDEQEVAIDFGAFSFSLEHPGLYVIYGFSSMGTTAEQLEAAIEKELDKVKSDLISDREYQKIRNQVENSIISGNSTLEGVANNLAKFSTFFDDANLVNTELDKFLSVTKEDILRVAQKYLVKDNRTVLYYLPNAQKKN